MVRRRCAAGARGPATHAARKRSRARRLRACAVRAGVTMGQKLRGLKDLLALVMFPPKKPAAKQL